MIYLKLSALGEHMYGSNDMFVKAMNKEAKKLGMENTNFKNCTGFDDKEHYSSCYDMSILACELVKFGETLFQYTRLKEAYLREDTSSPFWLVNTNTLKRINVMSYIGQYFADNNNLYIYLSVTYTPCLTKEQWRCII